MIAAYTIVLLAALAAAAGCFRVSAWHSAESAYWYRIHALWLLDPTGTDAQFLPVLVWKRAHPPTVWERIRGWRDPVERMAGPRRARGLARSLVPAPRVYPERWRYMSRRQRVWWWLSSLCWLPLAAAPIGVTVGALLTSWVSR